MKVVVNATPLIALSLINQLELLNKLFDEVFVPLAVYQEVVIQGSGQPGSAELASVQWIQVQAPRTSPTIEPLLLGLDKGELQVLLLAKEIQADWVIIDERLGRRIARTMKLPVKGTVGIMLAACQAGLISKTRAIEAVHQLSKQGIHISSQVMAWFESELRKN
ncbi:DUF3368 domain-containing protein [Aetokthonos hydrillicola Thurmond2011]|uniref:DUF3368 domain-containing protein n=1 Tax=Aetokthonos hydrillicola Thurmond2011 TaxID=2712845 RepID=A0AAP5IGN5_9CYAN|nr:DUF3368 domain-containing protein [Aetokthonos hydrillicola]MBO3457939.1 DUF3368 domain-containing protein [Aetokthonos hydrillicola CCALA 1050]MBW4587429.1 DUF3368 domain-containing protein [Aetokthonos hydrillicola CCALA 1050]MDR9899997.1 DUF3368 domain-containing protein [Aetokthonos hydrillicola Thurmond2011]